MLVSILGGTNLRNYNTALVGVALRGHPTFCDEVPGEIKQAWHSVATLFSHPYPFPKEELLKGRVYKQLDMSKREEWHSVTIPRNKKRGREI